MNETRELLERFRRGDRGAQEAILQDHQGVVYGYVRARVVQAADAEDLTQEVFLRAFKASRSFRPDVKVRPWLIGIARNVLKERARRLRRQKESTWTDVCLELDDLVESADPEEPDDMIEHLPGCLESLGPHARQAIDLHYGSRLRLVEIGSRLRRSEGAVKLLLFRARQVLKLCLGSKCGGPEP